ncbi:hydroxymethylglutaryl-CoA lyase [Diaphorobacter sp.]|uniref:hydroxymethylglutaryl-CoA lyase n=1 Tax=Diaphorobacter sp. TaxID=1934310 RepID=UPI0028ABF938|nr:hydroxymethylglutaryl-CoA lyase [Diaphorobacter sp.]
MREKVTITEVGPRDGLQLVPDLMPTDVKLEWIRGLFQAGLRDIEVGSFVSPRLVPQMADSAEVVRQSLLIDGLTVYGLAANMKGAMAAYEAGVQVMVIPLSVSDRHSRANVNKGTLEHIEAIRDMIEWVRQQARPVRLDVVAASAFGCSVAGVVPLDDVVRATRALDAAGADRIVLADTVGYAYPSLVRDTVRAVQDAVGTRLSKLHLHDTMGLGTANALAGLQEGIRHFDACMGGLGGCPFAPGASGNIVTEDLVFMLESMGYDTGVDLPALLAVRERMQSHLPPGALRGGVAAAGVPATYQARAASAAA